MNKKIVVQIDIHLVIGKEYPKQSKNKYISTGFPIGCQHNQTNSVPLKLFD
jgi:hypothetical protein